MSSRYKVKEVGKSSHSEVVEETSLKQEKVPYIAPDFGRDSTMVSQQDRPTLAPRFSTQGDMFGRLTE